MVSGKNSAPEILAPAGNLECLKAAVSMGADAVYLAGKDFGARSYADNFSDDELEECVRYSHLRGVRVYVTVNTLIGDREIDRLKEYLKFLDGIKADALIIQDLAILRLVRELKLGIRLHASTQLTVHNLAGALAAAQMGFVRVVLARELSFDEIKYISENCGIETEIFVHGAMCMSYSGQCLMSSVLGGRSGNRGKCAQPCRQLYQIDGKEQFYLSLKDMALAEHIDKICESGAASLKIEGRMKGPAYVASTVKTYVNCVSMRRNANKSELEALNRIFYRGGLSAGYFENKKGTQMFAFDKPDNPYKRGSETAAKKILEEAREIEQNRNIPVKAEIEFVLGEKVKLVLSSGDVTVAAESEDVVEPAVTTPMDEERIVRQISKTGNSIFAFSEISVSIEGSGYVSVKELNDLRRRAILCLEEKLLSGFRCDTEYRPLPKAIEKTVKYSGFTVSVRNYEQYSAVLEFELREEASFALIGVPIDELCSNPNAYTSDNERIVIEPRIIMHKDEYDDYDTKLKSLYDMGFRRLRVHNISELGRAERFVLLGSERLNVLNGTSAELCREMLGLSAVMLSPELNIPQICEIAANVPAEVRIYGYQPIMITENCIIKNLNKCPCGSKTEYLTDRFRTNFPIIRDGSGCRTVLLNSCPTFLADKPSEIKKMNAALLNLSFTIEPPNEVQRICKAYLKGDEYKPKEFTRLHFYKGVVNKKI